MHIPDGFVSGSINGAAMVISAGAVAFSAWRVKREFKDRQFAVPLLATISAFVFAAQMLNFPIGGGTSGHFLGAVTAAALLGPWSACIVLSVVLVIQGLIFGDGGISALGSNIFNMGIIGGIACYPVMRGIRSFLPDGRRGYLTAAAIAGWLSVVLASSACALELAASGTSPLMVALPAMAGTHAIIGIGEAMITVAVLSAVASARPDIVPLWARVSGGRSVGEKGSAKLVLAGLALAFALAVFGSPFASSSPDGLEKVAEDKGFMQAASEDKVVWNGSLFPDYKVEAIQSEGVSTSLAGLIGTMMVFGLGFCSIRIMVRAKGTKV
ncbi:MAG: energy-coupling factor ABC transporter permease [Alphaproteobacteria bacterium]|nr:energy-coupling factor ABC transporter permease [Alphaproteobacteria bacterium]